MTTIVVDRRLKEIWSDTQNTATDGSIYRSCKIEILKNGRIFLGSGHCHSIGDIKRWAYQNCDEEVRPDFSYWLDDPGTYSSTCLVICTKKDVMWLIDDELECLEIEDSYIAIGSGAAYAIGAMDAGCPAKEALWIACGRDGSTSLPYHGYNYGDGKWQK